MAILQIANQCHKLHSFFSVIFRAYSMELLFWTESAKASDCLIHINHNRRSYECYLFLKLIEMVNN